ncbi:TRAP transporter large permease subunit [uncultured Reyranella sp.]|jgi:tripartite ATP-independent transporter DctM subunit|uniref:TRAP transporter large permease n=1 Tax=uncultured Reyranella sp. TaxID=735512 RepID=UPI0025DDBE01|nr:TRAP transporter large permease subunit [uncultured Reyranella sp.]
MTEIFAPAMFLCLVLVLFAGFPVAFSLAAVAGAFGAIGVTTGHFNVTFLNNMLFRIQGTFNNDNLLALPLLIFMGMLLERTGIAEEMFTALNRLFGRLSGGLAYTTIVVGAALSAITGFVSASVVAIGLISLPVMLRARYDPKLATGVVAAAGTLAQVIPPSLVLIILAEQLEVSLLEIYRGALLPAALLVALYLSYIFLVTRLSPERAPSTLGRYVAPRSQIVLEVVRAAVLPLGIVSAVLAAIYFGVATPTEGGAIGVVAVVLLALATRKLTGRNLRQAMDVTGILCSGIIFLLLGASFFMLVFRGLEGHLWIESLFTFLPAGQVGFIVFINVAIFFLAFFLDFFEIAFIVLPLIAPIARHLGIDMVWFTVLLAVNLQTSFMHPPFGIALYNLRSVTPSSVSTSQIYWGAVPFLALQILMVGLLIAVPQIVTRTPAPAADPATINIELAPPPAEN